jgi:peptide/nickel transport system ATP-binding protein
MRDLSQPAASREASPDPAVPGTPSDGGARSPILEAPHLRKLFPVHHLNPFAQREAVHAVEDTSLALYPGRATALVGESGSGKTTVARMLDLLYAPTSGDIKFQGQPVHAKGRRALREYRRHVQMIFQDPFSSLNPVHDVFYHLSRPLRVYRHARSGAQVRAQALTLLERVSLTPAEQFLRKYPHELSGGQRQRVAIARALAVRPSVLLADEPVSMLDVSIRLDILNLLSRLKDEDQLAILYITHDIASARYFAEEMLVMYAGQTVEGGTSEEITQRPMHPYTQLLLSAAPDPDRLAGEGGLAQLPARGEIPSLVRPPSGCRFHPRCPHAMPVCRERFPQRTSLGDGHWVHCFLYGEDSGMNGRHEAAVAPAATATQAETQPADGQQADSAAGATGPSRQD